MTTLTGYFTVSHTGTQFFRKHYFGERGDRWKDLGDPTADDVVFAHCTAANAPKIEAFQGPIITTYRDPLLAAVSWYARDKFCNGYGPWRAAWECWARVRDRAITVLNLHEAPHYLVPVNSQRRNSLIHHLLDSSEGDLTKVYQVLDEKEVEWARRIAHASY